MRDLPADIQRFRSTVDGQWGIVTLAQLRALGWGDGRVRHALATGRLIRLHRAVYAVGHTRLLVEGRFLAAVLASGPGAALSLAAAAHHLDLRRSSAARIDVTVPSGRKAQPGIRLHRPRDLEPGDVVVHHGIPTTSPTRTVIDFARARPLPVVERLAAAAERRQLLDHTRLARARSRKLRLIFGDGRGPQLTRSRDERRFLAAVRAAGLPKPESNLWLTHGGGEEWEPDFVFLRERVIVEIDDDSHKTAHAFELDRHKDAIRQAEGYATPRFTRRQLREDLAGAMAVLARILDDRGNALPSR